MVSPPQQNLGLAESVLEGVQIGGMAGRDLTLTQIQGGIGTMNVFSSVQVAKAPVEAAKPLTQQEYRWRQVLIDKVRQFWIEGILANSLHSQAMIELGLEEKDSLVQDPLESMDELTSRNSEVLPVGTALNAVFDDMGTGRTLLILGEPGAGKTVTLLKLAESLVVRAQSDLSQPLPVVINLSSWRKSQSIADWLIQELHQIYGLSKSLGNNWIKAEQLLFLLDGLDEVNSKEHNDCVRALNLFIAEHGLTEMVICSRIGEYENLDERLKLRNAIYVQPLTRSQINRFLTQAGESLSALKLVLQNNDELMSFASSPLILSIMSFAYKGFSAGSLTAVDTATDHKEQLFDTYINRMLERRGTTTKDYSKQQTIRWLVWLAQRMEQSSQTVLFIERLQPIWLDSSRRRFLHRMLSALLIGVFLGGFYSLFIFVMDGVRFGWLAGLGSGLIELFLGVPLIVLLALFFAQIETVETLKWSWREAKKNFLTGSIIGGIFALISHLSDILIHGWDSFLVIEVSSWWLRLLLSLLVILVYLSVFFGCVLWADRWV